MAVQMEISRIFIREVADLQFIELKEVDGERTFPIAIGLPEAQALERRIKGVKPPRPQTHDLLATAIAALGANIESVCIHDLSDNTFYARIVLRRIDGGAATTGSNGTSSDSHADETIEIDSRPSDAIALGAANNVPIYVEESVLDRIEAEEPM